MLALQVVFALHCSVFSKDYRLKAILANTTIEVGPIEIFNGLILLAGSVLLIIWLARSAGSLAKSRVRRNKLAYYMPFLLIFIWLAGMAGGSSLLRKFFGIEEGPESNFTDYVAVTGVEIAMILLFLCIARKYFARGLGGFGLDFRTVWKDFPAALLNYVTVFPLVILSIFLVTRAGELIGGDEFQMQQNAGLGVLAESGGAQMCLLIFSFVLVVPVFEELLFRGLLQSALRSFGGKAWVAIIIASVLFMLMHPWMHWPALFFLSCCMGYTYEKSGSLLRAIFVHAIFNAINITGSFLI